MNNDPKHAPKHDMIYNKHNHGNERNATHLFSKKAHMHSELSLWNELSHWLEVKLWSIHGRSALGDKYFGEMNPWDDGIDLTVIDCAQLMYRGRM